MISIRQRSLTPSLALSLLLHILLVIAVGLRYQSSNLPRLESYEVDLVYRVRTLQVESARQLSDISDSSEESVATALAAARMNREKSAADTSEDVKQSPLYRSEVFESEVKTDEFEITSEVATEPHDEKAFPVASAQESSYSISANAYDFEGLLAELRSRISASLVYPRIARKRGIEGTVVLRLRLDGNGNLAFLKVIGSSGSDILDRSAQELIRKVLPYRHGAGRAISIEIPIVYRFEKQ